MPRFSRANDARNRFGGVPMSVPTPPIEADTAIPNRSDRAKFRPGTASVPTTCSATNAMRRSSPHLRIASASRKPPRKRKIRSRVHAS